MKHLQERYQRQLMLNDFGLEAQEKLSNAKVLVIGAGGLGCPILQYLVAAGVGHIGIADDDTISYSNLNRQILFGQQDVGSFKVDIAKEKLLLMNETIAIKTWKQRWSQKDCLNHFKDYNIIIDATDNFASRYLINDACVLLGKPLVFGAVSKFEGQVAVFNVPINEKEKTVNYRDLFPEPPNNDEVLNCEEAGVIGVLPGIIGTMMANETIKLITGIGEPLLDRLLTYNSLNNHFFEMDLLAMPETAKMIPAGADEFKAFNYDWFCNLNSNFDLKHEDFEIMMNEQDIQIVDVREQGEEPFIHDFNHIHIPLSHLKVQIPDIDAQTIVLFCQSGKRSAGAAEILSKHYGKSRKIYSLKDGIAGWQRNK